MKPDFAAYDNRMPEEHNRILADRLSRLLFCPTEGAREILLGEGYDSAAIHVTGNTVVDTLNSVGERADRQAWPGEQWGIGRGEYYLVTLHRPENVDNPDLLKTLLETIDSAAAEAELPALLPLHPRTRERMKEHAIVPGGNIRIVEPVGLPGVRGVAEKRTACNHRLGRRAGRVLHTWYSLRNRTQVHRAAGNYGSGCEYGYRNRAAGYSGRDSVRWPELEVAGPIPFGDGRAGERIVEIVLETLAG